MEKGEDQMKKNIPWNIWASINSMLSERELYKDCQSWLVKYNRSMTLN